MLKMATLRNLHQSIKSKISIQQFKRQLSVTVYCHQEFLRTSIKDDEKGIRRITLDDTKKRNALSLAMLDELKQHLQDVNMNESVKVVVLCHTGSVFSAGHDLKELLDETGSKFHSQIFNRCTEVMNLVQDIDVPVIAEVRGVATAAGCQLVATCDLAICSDTSKFAVPGVLIGLFCSTPAVALARAVNRKQALKMLLTGDPINAKEALDCGLVNKTVPIEDVEKTTQELAERITRHSSRVIGLGKKTFYQQIKENRDEAYCITGNVMVDNLTYEDAQEGIRAFFEKRQPEWQNNK
eukprot:TCONS_00059798-protein